MQNSRQLYEIFKLKFPQMIDDIRLWGPFDKDALKVETKDHGYYVFTYYSTKDWGLQTYKNYIDSRRITPRS